MKLLKILPLSFFLLCSAASNAHENDKKWGKAVKYAEKKMDFSYLESSKRYSNDPSAYETDIPFIKGEWYKVDSFFISKYEVSNEDYDEFLSALYSSKILQDQIATYDEAYPIDSNWRFVCYYDSNHDNFKEYFLENNRINKEAFSLKRIEYYDKLPRVNVTFEQAVKYCQWRTLNYNSDPKRKFEKVLFRLPTKLEWEYAAQDRRSSEDYPLSFSCISKRYTCESEPFDENGKLRCNFSYSAPGLIYVDTTWEIIDTVILGKEIYDSIPEITFKRYWNKWQAYGYCGLGLPEYLLENVELNDFVNTYFPMLPIATFGPQHAGLYQMAGNVREMVQEKGLTKGGSWRLPFLYNHIRFTYKDERENYSDVDLGFRVVMEIKEI